MGRGSRWRGDVGRARGWTRELTGAAHRPDVTDDGRRSVRKSSRQCGGDVTPRSPRPPAQAAAAGAETAPRRRSRRSGNARRAPFPSAARPAGASLAVSSRRRCPRVASLSRRRTGLRGRRAKRLEDVRLPFGWADRARDHDGLAEGRCQQVEVLRARGGEGGAQRLDRFGVRLGGSPSGGPTAGRGRGLAEGRRAPLRAVRQLARRSVLDTTSRRGIP